MTLQELEKQMLQLPSRERWQLVQVLLVSLQQEALEAPKNLSRLRGIAKASATPYADDSAEDYINYLTQKYQ